MKKVDLYFSEEEMLDLLKKRGYQFDVVKTWSSYNTYHNQVENSYQDVMIAYKKFYNIGNEIDGTYRLSEVEKFKVENVFIKELKEKLLS
jgi:hypothetical protein